MSLRTWNLASSHMVDAVARSMARIAPTGPVSPSRSVYLLAMVAGGGFAAFYALYTGAPASPKPGDRLGEVEVGWMMLAVIGVQPLFLLRAFHSKARVVCVALSLMAFGPLALLVNGGLWAVICFGAGFGSFVVVSAAWAKEVAPPGGAGRALGLYGFGSALGGALGAPVGLAAQSANGLLGVVTVTTGLAVLAACPLAWLWRPPAHGLGPDIEEGSSPEDAPWKGEFSPPALRHQCQVLGLTMAAHLGAVTAYAFALSSLSQRLEFDSNWMPMAGAVVIQVSQAVGRLLGGKLADQLPSGLLLLSSFGLTLAMLVPLRASSCAYVALVSLGALGVGAGCSQTTALTRMMRLAHTARSTQAISAGWNMIFDCGLGVGSVLVTVA